MSELAPEAGTPAAPAAVQTSVLSSTSRPDQNRRHQRAPWRRRYQLSAAGREARRRAIQQRKPWLKSTGPRTTRGKRRSAVNGLRNLELWTVVTVEVRDAGGVHTSIETFANGCRRIREEASAE